jgi:hypothetical protein
VSGFRSWVGRPCAPAPTVVYIVLGASYVGVLILDAVLVENAWVQFVPVAVAILLFRLGEWISGRRRAAALGLNEIPDFSMHWALDFVLMGVLVVAAVIGGAIWGGTFLALYIAVDSVQETIRRRRWYASQAAGAA